MFNRFFSFAAVAMLALIVLAACGGEEADEAAQDVATRIPNVPGAPAFEPVTGASPAAGEAAAEPAGGEAAPAGDAAAAGGGGGEVTVASVDIAFEPEALTIPANTDVVVLLPNNGAAQHNFSIDALGISVDQAPGQTDQKTTINAPAGTYEYYCNVPGHKQAGMVGTLTVQ